MSFREFLQKLNLASFHDALFEVTGLEVLEDYVKHVEEEDLEGLLEPAHGMRKPQLRKLWSALLELRQQMKATAAPAHAPRSQERDKGGDHGAAEGSPPSGQRREAASRPSAGTPTASRPTPAEGRSASGDRGGAAAAPPAGAAQGSAAAAEGSGGWGWGDASRRARADLAEIQKRKAEAVSSRERGSSSPSRTEAATAARPAKAAKKTKAQRPGGQAGQDPKERLQMEKAVLVLEDLIGKEEVKRAGLASRSPGDVGKRFTDLSMLYKRLKRTPLSNDFGPKPYRALAARYVCPPPASRDRPLGVQPEKKPVGIALEVTADELERRHQRRLRFDAYLQRRGVPTVLDASGPERLKGLSEEGSAKSRAQDARPPQPAAGKEQAADDDDDDWGDWTAPAPAIPVSRSLQQARREEPDSRTAEARTTSSEAPASAAPTSKEPCAGSEAESDPYLCLEEGEADSDSDSSVPDVEEA